MIKPVLFAAGLAMLGLGAASAAHAQATPKRGGTAVVESKPPRLSSP